MTKTKDKKKASFGEKMRKSADVLLKKSPYALDEEEQENREPQSNEDHSGIGANPFTLTEEEQKQIDEAQANAPVSKRKHHWYGVPVGTVVLCFALIGFAWICTQVGQYIHSVVTDDSVERAYDTYLAPVVMFDPQPFESLAAADKATIHQAAVWKTVFDHIDDIENYDDQARLIVPAELVRESAAKLFGVDCLITTETFQMHDYTTNSVIEVLYTDADDSYHIPLMEAVGAYQPYVVSKRSRSGATILKVAYCVVIDLDSVTDPDVEIVGENLAVMKYMEYEIGHDHDTDMDYIKAIRTVN